MVICSGHLQTKSADMLFAFEPYETSGSRLCMVHKSVGLYNYPHKGIHNSLTYHVPESCPFHWGADQAHTGNLLAFRNIDRTSQKIYSWEIKLSLYTQDRLKYSLNTSDNYLTHIHLLEKPSLTEVPAFLVIHSTKSIAPVFLMSTLTSLASFLKALLLVLLSVAVGGRIIEYLKLEEKHRGHQVQLPSQRTT